MNTIRGMLTVFRFEWKRSLTGARMAWWLALTAFPPGLLGLIRLTAGAPPADMPQPAVFAVYILCVCVACMMGVFLWAAPAVLAELEGRSWVYLAVRPGGTTSVLLGKYLTAVVWALPVGIVSSTLSLLIMSPAGLLSLIWVMWRLVALSCIGYAATFLLIGVLFPKRAMVVGIFYVFAFEVVMAMVPALVNLLTVQYRLWNLLVRWWPEGNLKTPAMEIYFGDAPAWWHATMLLCMTAAVLFLATQVLRWREFTTSSEGDI